MRPSAPAPLRERALRAELFRLRPGALGCGRHTVMIAMAVRLLFLVWGMSCIDDGAIAWPISPS